MNVWSLLFCTCLKTSPLALGHFDGYFSLFSDILETKPNQLTEKIIGEVGDKVNNTSLVKLIVFHFCWDWWKAGKMIMVIAVRFGIVVSDSIILWFVLYPPLYCSHRGRTKCLSIVVVCIRLCRCSWSLDDGEESSTEKTVNCQVLIS